MHTHAHTHTLTFTKYSSRLGRVQDQGVVFKTQLVFDLPGRQTEQRNLSQVQVNKISQTVKEQKSVQQVIRAGVEWEDQSRAAE